MPQILSCLEINFFLFFYFVLFVHLSLSELELYRRKKISVKGNSGSNTVFLIKAKDLGHISIKVTANSALAGDAVERKLLVKVRTD